jgi:hypothetical protein
MIRWSIASAQSKQQPQGQGQCTNNPTWVSRPHLPPCIDCTPTNKLCCAPHRSSCAQFLAPSLALSARGPCLCSIAWKPNLLTGAMYSVLRRLTKWSFSSAASVRQKKQLQLCVWLLDCQQCLVLAA